MASVVYPKAKEAMLTGAVNLSSGTVKAALIDTGAYTYNSAHDFYDDVPSGAIVAVSGALANKTVTNGTFDADDITLTNVTGATVEAVIVFLDTGTPATSRLLAYIDSGSGLPYTPNGATVTISWNLSGIFNL